MGIFGEGLDSVRSGKVLFVGWLTGYTTDSLPENLDNPRLGF